MFRNVPLSAVAAAASAAVTPTKSRPTAVASDASPLTFVLSPAKAPAPAPPTVDEIISQVGTESGFSVFVDHHNASFPGIDATARTKILRRMYDALPAAERKRFNGRAKGINASRDGNARDISTPQRSLNRAKMASVSPRSPATPSSARKLSIASPSASPAARTLSFDDFKERNAKGFERVSPARRHELMHKVWSHQRFGMEQES